MARIVTAAALLVGTAAFGPPVGPASAAAARAIVPVVPGRILETRSGPNDRTVDGVQQGSGAVVGGGEVVLRVGGRHGVPGDASAVILNVTAVAPEAAGFLTVYPCGSPRPLSSSVNYSAGQVVPNAVLAKLGEGGAVCIWTKATTHVLADVTGYVPGAGGPAGGGPGGGGTGGETAATFFQPALDRQEVAIGPDGTAHLVYTKLWGDEAWYASCSAECSTSAAWTHTKILTIGVDESAGAGTGGVGVDASGRVHALITGGSWAGFAFKYATCAANCGSAASWAVTDLTGPDEHLAADTPTVLMVAPDGSVSFVAAGFDEWAEWQVKYYGCASECTSTASWTVTGAFNGLPVMAVRDAAGITHVLSHLSLFDADLRYARCVSACADPANWQVAAGSFPAAAGGPSLAVTGSGQAFVGYLQFGLDNGDDGRYLVRSCATDCGDLTTWQGFSIGAELEGQDGASLEADGDGVLLLTTAGADLLGRLCQSACHTASGFGAPLVVDTNLAVGADVNSVVHAQTDICESAEPNWWTQHPVAAIGAGRLVVAHNPWGSYVCSPDNVVYSLASIGRAIADF